MSVEGPDRPVVIAGGGTGGHVVPGLAVARELVRRGRDPHSILFVGSARGIEARLVPEAGFAVELLPGRGIQRRLTLENLGAIWGLTVALWRALRLLAALRPAVVLSLGGYASVAAALAAVVLRIPVVISEQNARAGAANRLIGRFAAASAVPFESTDLPRATVCGNPVRPEILERAHDRRRDEARDDLGVPEGRRIVAVFAGSLGATTINRATVGLVERWAARRDVHVHHVWGSRDWETAALPEVPAAGISYRGVRFEEHMDVLLAAADVAVCRSGGTTVAELAAVGVPAVLVPFPLAPRDHQTANAAPLVAAGAARVVPDDQLDADRLATELGAVLDGGRLEEMAAAARSLGRPDAATAVAELLEQHVR